MRTIQLYYTQSDLRECNATIVARFERDGKPAVELDATIFYPEGGGQPCDTGTMDGIPVNSVVKEGERVIHVLESPLPDGSARVHCAIDGARRRDHAEQHSGQHLLSALLNARFGIKTVSFHLGDVISTIDIDCPALSDTTACALEDEAFSLIRSGKVVKVHELSRDDASKLPLRKDLPEGEDSIRVVEIDGLDWSPCCGTHLADLSNLGLVLILDGERYKGRIRLHFVAGARALAQWRRMSLVARSVASAFECALDDAPERARVFKERTATLEFAVRKFKAERAKAEALAAVGEKGAAIVRIFADRDYDEALETAKAMIGAGARLAVCASGLDKKVVVMGNDPSLALGARLKILAESMGGRGGGSPTMFQASFPTVEEMTKFADALPQF